MRFLGARDELFRRATAAALVVAFLFAGLGYSLLHRPAPHLWLRWPGGQPATADADLVTGPPPAPAETGPPRIAPEAASKAVALIESEVEREAFPGAALAAGTRDRIELERGFGKIGWTSAAEPVGTDSTMYDLASVTKVVGTTAAVMLLVEEGKMKLDDPVQRYVPGFEGRNKDQVTVRHLLAHTSALPPGAAIRGSTPREVVRRLLRTRLGGKPGDYVEYSDLGFIVLWEAATKAAGESLPGYLERKLYKPLGMNDTEFAPGLDCTACAPTGRLRDQRLYRGKPFDRTAQAAGGITGSSGLFSTAHDVGRFAAMIANEGELDGVRVLRPETIREFLERQPGAKGRMLGWDRMCIADGDDPCASIAAYGHTGYAGTSLWIEPGTGRWVVLLTNRTYEQRAPNRIQKVRRTLWDYLSVGGATRPVADESTTQ